MWHLKMLARNSK